MSKTKLEVVAQAHRTLGVLATDENPSADMISYAGTTLDALVEELAYVQGLGVPFDSDDTPDELFLPMADYLASEIAPHYGVAGPARSRAIGRIRANLACDDR